MKIVVLCGGLSPERNVSISSGTKIASALAARGHQVVLTDMFLGLEDYPGDLQTIFENPPALGSAKISSVAPDLEAVKASRKWRSPSHFGKHVLEVCAMADIVFLALHGEEGENGKLQALFDIHGIRYTGSGYLGSAIAMDKSLTKTVLSQTDVPVPGGITLKKGHTPYGDPGFPCVVKPCSGGSSVGTTIVHGPEEYEAALDLAFRYEDSVTVENYITGRVLTVGVLDGKAMPVIEIIPKNGFYDYKNKYQPGLTEELCPAPITPEETALVQRLAEEAYRALRLDAYGRVDFIMDPQGVCWCLEANTLPGMTPTSLVPQMGAAMGLEYGALCEKLLEASLKKYE